MAPMLFILCVLACAALSQPPIPIEPTPPILEPNAGIFAVLLSYGANSSVMGVTFHSSNDTLTKYPNYSPSIIWSTSLDALQQQGAPTESAPCSTSKPHKCYTDSPLAHYCNMTNLASNTRYYYTVGDDKIGRTKASSNFSFTAPPKAGSKVAGLTTTAVVYGDMGLDYSENTRARLASLAAAGDFDFVIHNGDISYADNRIGERNGTVYQDWLNLFFANVSAYASRVPYMMSPGNHGTSHSFIPLYM